MKLTEATRHWLYGIVAAIIAILATYGIIGPDEVPVWTALAIAILGVGTGVLANRNTDSTRTPPPPSDSAV